MHFFSLGLPHLRLLFTATVRRTHIVGEDTHTHTLANTLTDFHPLHGRGNPENNPFAVQLALLNFL